MVTGPVLAPVIEPVTADDRAGLAGWFALVVACHAHDSPDLPPPCPRCHANRFSWPGFAQQAWVARDGAGVVAAANVVLPQRDVLDHGFADVLVVPSRRRRGLGTQLLAHLVAQSRAAGRTRLFFDVGGPLTSSGPGNAFLRAAGARLGMLETRRRL